MKTLIFTLCLLLGLIPALSAEVFTTESITVYQTGVEQVVAVTAPANCSALQGEVIVSENCSLVSITESYGNKEVATNGNKFIIYGLNNEVMAGANILLTIVISNNSEAFVGISAPLGATPDAIAISIDSYTHIMTSGLDLNGDGVTDANDVAFAIDNIYTGDMDVVDLQTIINAAIAEM